MNYKDFYVKILPDDEIIREGKNGEKIRCKGFMIEIFADESERIELDVFSAAVDFELLKNDASEAEQFAKEYIDCEEKELKRLEEKVI